MTFIKSRQPAKAKIWGKQQPSTPVLALVYTNNEGECLVVQNGEYALNSEVRHGKYNTVYEVDTSVYSYTFHKEVMCEDGQSAFLIRMRISYYVGNPEIIVRRGIVNSTNMLDELLFYSIKEVTRDYPIDQVRAVNEALKGLQNDSKFNRVFGEYGLAVEALEVDVELGHEARERLKRKMKIKDEIEEQDLKSEGDMQRVEKYGVAAGLSSKEAKDKFLVDQHNLRQQEIQKEIERKNAKEDQYREVIIQRLKDGDDIRDIEEMAQTLKRIDSGKDFVSSEADVLEKAKWGNLAKTSEFKRKERLDG
ncbi:hypothetical protein [Bacillus luti]|uniref:Band 7 domain-containing protein n=1 Tax=Bacillus luti TaxID=2026191 RepID=A0A7V7V6I8_9BACI|nr:hypothetical protein [Bacillus luti]KAB2444905.1 hypothetical protein F8163_06885 [Bacillus luti]